MNILMTSVLTAAALSLAGGDGRDESFKSREYGLQFKLPAGGQDRNDWTLRTDPDEFTYGWGKKTTLAEISNKETLLGGVLEVYTSAMTAEKFAEWRLESWRTLKGVTNVRRIRDEKRYDKSIGEWALREYTYDYNGSTFHYLDVFIAHGKYNIELALWSVDSAWESNEELAAKIVKTLTYTGVQGQ